jgi:hypothetical protein
VEALSKKVSGVRGGLLGGLGLSCSIDFFF